MRHILDPGQTLSPASKRRAAALLPMAAAIALSTSACILDLSDLSAQYGAGGGGSAQQGSVLGCDPCPNGDCAPSVVANGLDVANEPWDVAVGSDGVYWVNQAGGRVMRLVEGAAVPETLTTSVGPSAIAVGGGRVFWSAQDAIWMCPVSGCDAGKQQLSQAIAPGSPGRITFDGLLVYFTDHGTTSSNGRVMACDPASCAQPTVLSGDRFAPDDIVTQGSSVFWADLGDGQGNGTVFRSPKTGGPSQIISALFLPTAVAADGSYVYFLESVPGGKVQRCPVSGGYCNTPEDIAPADAFKKPFDLVISGGRIYWSNVEDGSIRSCPTPGCSGEAPRVHVSGRQGLRRFALGGSCIFWVDDTSGGSVMKVGR